MKKLKALRAALAATLALLVTSCSGLKPGSAAGAAAMQQGDERFAVPHPAVAKPATPPPDQGGDYSPPIKDFGRGQYWARMDDKRPFRTVITHEGKTYTCDVSHGGNVIWHPGQSRILTMSQDRVPAPVVTQANEDIRLANWGDSSKGIAGRECAPLTPEEEAEARAMMAAFSSWQIRGSGSALADAGSRSRQ